MCTKMNELSNHVENWRSLKALKEELEEQLKAIESEIVGYLDYHQKVSETGSDFTVKISYCSRTTLDSKRLQEDIGSLAEYERTSNYRRLYVK